MRFLGISVAITLAGRLKDLRAAKERLVKDVDRALNVNEVIIEKFVDRGVRLHDLRGQLEENL